jgi:hypothetical protein
LWAENLKEGGASLTLRLPVTEAPTRAATAEQNT